MKQLIILFSVLFLTSCAGWSGQAKIYKTIPSDSERIIQSSAGAQISAKHTTGIYPFLSYEATRTRFGGQSSAGDIDLWGFGFGIERPIHKNVSLFCQVGWYQPAGDSNGKVLKFPADPGAEGLWIYLNQNLVPPFNRIDFPLYSLEYSGNIGGVIGANFEMPISNNISFSLSTAYRYLQLREKIRGMFSLENPDSWCFYSDRDFGGWLIGGIIELRF